MTETRRSRLSTEVDFERDGKQTGFIRLFHSVHSSAYGFIPIPIVVIRNGEGPTALFISGTHGDEYEGQVAISNLVKSLEPAQIRGRVILLPMANFPAAVVGRRTSPIDEVNLNRVFPGDPDGSVTQQIAYYISTALIPLADMVFDVHSGGSSLLYMPSVSMKMGPDKTHQKRAFAAMLALGAPLAYVPEGGQGTGQDQTLGGEAVKRGIVALGSELGGAGTVTPAGLRIAERALRNLLVHVGILPETARIAPEGPMRVTFVGGADYFVYASEGGVWEPCVELGDMVKAGQLAARIHTPETPWAPPAEVRFARDGLVLVKRIPGRTVRGDCLFHLSTDAPDMFA
jgi:predicted deacylase